MIEIGLNGLLVNLKLCHLQQQQNGINGIDAAMMRNKANSILLMRIGIDRKRTDSHVLVLLLILNQFALFRFVRV